MTQVYSPSLCLDFDYGADIDGSFDVCDLNTQCGVKRRLFDDDYECDFQPKRVRVHVKPISFVTDALVNNLSHVNLEHSTNHVNKFGSTLELLIRYFQFGGSYANVTRTIASSDIVEMVDVIFQLMCDSDELTLDSRQFCHLICMSVYAHLVEFDFYRGEQHRNSYGHQYFQLYFGSRFSDDAIQKLHTLMNVY